MILSSLAELKLFDLRASKVGATSGCYDLLHFYHLHYLERCKALCDLLIVGVDSDELVKANKGKIPAVPEHQRVAMVAALKCVDAAFIIRDEKDLHTMGKVTSVLFKNGPTIYGKKVIFPRKLVIVPDILETTSTSQLIEKIRGKK